MFIYLTKKEMPYRLGHAFPKYNIAFVRKDVPVCLGKATEIHEQTHLDGYGELKAHLNTISKCPLGYLLQIIYSINPKRFYFYWKRLTGKDKGAKLIIKEGRYYYGGSM